MDDSKEIRRKSEVVMVLSEGASGPPHDPERLSASPILGLRGSDDEHQWIELNRRDDNIDLN